MISGFLKIIPSPSIFNCMMMMKSRYVFVLMLLQLFAIVSQAQDGKSWVSFRGNPALTGTTEITLPDSMKLLWSFQAGDAIKSSPVIGNGKIFTACDDGLVYCISEDGKLVWKSGTESSIEAPLLYLDNTIIAGNLEGKLLALNAENGQKKWEYLTEGQISGSSNWAFSADRKKKYILTGSYDYFLHCNDASTGKLIWKYESNNYVNGAAAIFDKTAIFGGCDGFLHLVDILKGDTISKINIGTYIASSVAIDGGKAYFGNYDGAFFCVDLTTKKIVWTIENSGVFIASPAVSREVAVIGSQDKNVYCFEKSDGKIRWKFKTLGKVNGSPVIANNRVIFGSGDGRIYVLDLKTGEKLWSYEIGSPISSTPAVTKGLVVICAEDGSVHAFGEK